MNQPKIVYGDVRIDDEVIILLFINQYLKHCTTEVIARNVLEDTEVSKNERCLKPSTGKMYVLAIL